MIRFSITDLSVWYGSLSALKSISLEIKQNEILTIIGPANSGKTSLLRTLNRLNDLNPKYKINGKILLDGEDIYEDIDIETLRRRVGMIFALPSPLPMSVFENVAYGPQRHGIKDRTRLQEIVEKSLKSAYLWEEVKNRLNEPAIKLSGGQQQRLCIARTLAVEPEVILFDESCSGLDPISMAKVEEAMRELKKDYTVVLVTNNTKQAARVGDRTAFLLMGELVEIDTTDKIFTTPKDKRTEEYISGRFG
ncbi:MAG: phosphate ABC transporter ATP-binding protein PstB [Candidatus Edwardsbacteria bacterium]